MLGCDVDNKLNFNISSLFVGKGISMIDDDVWHICLKNIDQQWSIAEIIQNTQKHTCCHRQ